MFATLAAVVASAFAPTPSAAEVAAAACPGASMRPTDSNRARVDAATLCLINEVRAAHHLTELRPNRYLLGVAASQVKTMVSWDYFSDVRPSGQTPLSLVGITRYPAHAAAFAVGENIAWGTRSFSTPLHIVAAWMASPSHRAVILTAQYRDAGGAGKPAVPGVLRAGHSGATYAMEFGVRSF